METGFETKGWCQLEGQDFVDSEIVFEKRVRWLYSR